MSEVEKILLTTSLTVLSGTLVYVIGLLVSKFLIEPIHKQKLTIGEIADALIYYANIYGNPGTHEKDVAMHASTHLRKLSGVLLSRSYLIPLYQVLSALYVIRPLEDITEAAKALIGLSNSTYAESPGRQDILRDHSHRYVQVIQKKLKIPKTE